MSKPTAGEYYIVNRVTSLTGNTLALNYNGKDAVVTVVELQNLPTPSQVWIIKDYNEKTQNISPKSAPNLQADWDTKNGVIITNSSSTAIWSIRTSEGLTTVQDSGLKTFWGLKKAVNKEEVSYGTGTGSEKQNWVLVPA